MVLLDIDNFLLRLQRLYQAKKAGGSVWVTFKRGKFALQPHYPPLLIRSLIALRVTCGAVQLLLTTRRERGGRLWGLGGGGWAPKERQCFLPVPRMAR